MLTLTCSKYQPDLKLGKWADLFLLRQKRTQQDTDGEQDEGCINGWINMY